MAEILTKSQRAAMNTIVGKCNECRPHIEMLRLMGEDVTEFQNRLDHLHAVGTSSLDFDEMLKHESTVQGY